MKAKIGAIFLVSVMAFAAIGAAYAHWEETLTITGVMETDDIDPYFHCIESNDVDNWDPNECGTWHLVNGWQGLRRDKDVGSCTVQMGATTNEMEIDIDDALSEVVLKISKYTPYAVAVRDTDGKFMGYFSPKDYQQALKRTGVL